LRQEIWGQDTFVDFDKGLNFCIKQIREALGDNAQAPQYIETLPRRGYRFIAPVERLTPSTDVASPESADAHSPALASEATPERTDKRTRVFQLGLAVALIILSSLVSYAFWQRFNSNAKTRAAASTAKIMLAVLPFENLNADATQDYFSDGL